MKIIYNILFVIGTALFISCEADTSSSPAPEDVFVRIFGSTDSEVAADFVPDIEGDGFIIFGTTNSLFLKTAEDIDNNGSDRDYYVIRTDESGNQIDFKVFDYSYKTADVGESDPFFHGDEEAKRIIAMTDGSGYILAGSTTLPDQQGVSRAFIMKISTNLEILWGGASVYPANDASSITDVTKNEAVKELISATANSITLTADGELVLIGTTNDITNAKSGFPQTGAPDSDISDIWVVKFKQTFQDPNTNGEVFEGLNSGTISFELSSGFLTADEGKAIFERSDGTLVIVGSGEGKLDGNLGDILYATTNGQGFSNNLREIGTPDNDVISSAQLLADNGIVVVGYSETGDVDQSFVLRITSTGSFDQIVSLFPDKIFGEASFSGDASHRALGITELTNGDFAIVGEIGEVITSDSDLESNRRKEVLFMTTDGFGVLGDPNDPGSSSGSSTKIVKNFGGNGDDFGKAILQLADGRFAILANISYGGSPMIALIKTSASGDLIK